MGGPNREIRGFDCDTDLSNPFNAVGHNAVFEGPDGRLWLSCHGVSKYHTAPFLVMDPLNFDEEGNIEKVAPSYVPQIVKINTKS